MDDKLFGFVTTVGGLIVGWTLNELSYTFKARRENKKILNQILFTQLEIRDILKKTNLEEVEKQLTGILRRKFPESEIEGLTETVGKLFYAFIQNELNNKFSKKIQDLASEYKNYITTLSQIDPFTTYSISNKDVILDYLSYVKTYLSAIEDYLNKQVLSGGIKSEEAKSKRTFKMSFDSIAEKINPLLRNEAIETIETDIRIISRKIGLVKQFKTSRFIKRTQETKIQSADIKKIEFYLDSVLSKMDVDQN